GLVFDRDRRLADEGGDVVEGDDDAMIAVVADVVDQRAVPVEDQHVLLEAAGGEAVDRRQVADRLGGEGRHRHQRQSEKQQRTDQDDAPDSGAAVPFAEQAEPPMKDVARAAFAGHQARPNEPSAIPPGIMKDDSEYVGKCRALRSDSNTPERFFPPPLAGEGQGGGPYSGQMRIVRSVARPMLAGIFIAGGMDALANPEPRAQMARPVVDKVAAAVPLSPADPVTAVSLNALVHVGAGGLLAAGIFPMLSALS